MKKLEEHDMNPIYVLKCGCIASDVVLFSLNRIQMTIQMPTWKIQKKMHMKATKMLQGPCCASNKSSMDTKTVK